MTQVKGRAQMKKLKIMYVSKEWGHLLLLLHGRTPMHQSDPLDGHTQQAKLVRNGATGGKQGRRAAACSL